MKARFALIALLVFGLVAAAPIQGRSSPNQSTTTSQTTAPATKEGERRGRRRWEWKRRHR